jgi:phage terminase large subunit-like protein
LARKAEKAIALPGAQNAFRRMHLNEWTEQAERWIDMAAWDACDAPVSFERLRGRPCFGGLDLSTTTDVTALAWVFPPGHDDDLWLAGALPLLRACGQPEAPSRARSRPLRPVGRPGFIEATPGNVVDYGALEQRILADARSRGSPRTPGTPPLRLQDEGGRDDRVPPRVPLHGGAHP